MVWAFNHADLVPQSSGMNTRNEIDFVLDICPLPDDLCTGTAFVPLNDPKNTSVSNCMDTCSLQFVLSTANGKIEHPVNV